MAAYAALVSLMNNIEQMMNHPRVSNYLDNKQIQLLLEKAGLLLDIVEANNYGGASKQAEDLERQITSAAHAAEDDIEFHIVHEIHAANGANINQIHARKGAIKSLIDIERMKSKNIKELIFKKKQVQQFKRRMAGAAHSANPEPHTVYKIHAGTSSKLTIDLQQRIEAMDAAVEKAKHMELLVKEKAGSKEEQPSTPLLESGEAANAMVGLDDELTQLMDELTGHQSNRHIISIVGMGGMASLPQFQQ